MQNNRLSQQQHLSFLFQKPEKPVQIIGF